MLAIFLIIMGPALIGIIYDTASPYKQENFTDHKGEISITETTLYFSESGCKKLGALLIMGRVKNEGAITWTDISFEITLHDESGKLIDTAQKNDYAFVIPPNEEIPFKIALTRNFPEEAYASQKVRIISASQKDPYY